MENNNEGFDKLEFVNSPEELQQSLEADTRGENSHEPPTSSEEAPAEGEPTPQPSTEGEGQTQENAPELDNNIDNGETPQGSQQQTYSDQDIEGSVISFLSEKLGRDITSLDELTATQQDTPALDERIQAIADFVSETGRSPRDWFAYQSLNPSEMDDATAIRVNLAAQHPNLTSEEITMLIGDKYKLDTNLFTEEEVKLSQLQLKIDAASAKKGIEDIRNKYNAPDPEVASSKSFVTEEWITKASKEVDDLDGLEFDLGDGNTFKYGLNDSNRNRLKDQSARLDNYFDSYTREDGSWDFDALNTSLAVIDNIDAIVSAAYKQGKGDGQKGLVNRAANVDANPAKKSTDTNVNSVAEQLKQIIGSGSTTTFKI